MQLMEAWTCAEVPQKSKLQEASCCVAKDVIWINFLKVDIKCLQVLKVRQKVKLDPSCCSWSVYSQGPCDKTHQDWQWKELEEGFK